RPRLPAPFRIGSAVSGLSRHDLLAPLEDRLATRAPRMDRKQHRRLTRGRIEPEARLDLHGMTLERAQAALRGFVSAQAGRGARLVLVITGKGREEPDPGPIPVPRGRLRHELPRWLEMPPLVALVIDYAPAHRRHGGNGAYYLWLRRRGP
ncbi:MAG: Smr/MutS family protein, partial [Rhodobacteraceae bacterium]|nr:Smr/MutS family protein [Paracoccaceae bacterium]